MYIFINKNYYQRQNDFLNIVMDIIKNELCDNNKIFRDFISCNNNSDNNEDKILYLIY